MFCVECGRDGPTVDGLCTSCFERKHPVIEPPSAVDLPRCQHCGSLRLASGWGRMALEIAIPQVLQDQVAVRPPFRRATFTHVAREEDASNYALTVKAVGRYEGLEIVQDFHTRLRLKPTVCETCQRQDGRYYEGILQVRGAGRELTAKEKREIRTLVQAQADRGREAAGDFVSRTEDVRGGLDFYVSSNALGGRLAKQVASAYGGTIATSPKLYGQRKGKALYRVTTLVRLPAFQVGDVVRVKETLSEVLEVAPFLILRDLATGEARRFKAKDLRRARRLEAERFPADLEEAPDGRLVATHPESEAQRPIRTPGARGKRWARVVWWAEGGYVSELPAVISKP